MLIVTVIDRTLPLSGSVASVLWVVCPSRIARVSSVLNWRMIGSCQWRILRQEALQFALDGSRRNVSRYGALDRLSGLDQSQLPHSASWTETRLPPPRT